MTHAERKKLIKSKGLTHKRIAAQIHYTRCWVTKILKDPQESCRRVQTAIADLLGVDYDEFWGISPAGRQRDVSPGG